ncbi:ABC transporter ATP-binding protein [Cryptosporangium aurantiacum]|uniref:Iron complex transport system ATP-binding protein n=1 Tax=Cryptosporangium aurantiacum TaxID=134849 RepID=A0A1M7RK66_9ACTN|nr:ABC transporter ATP-binding protein [Cryptosporangium aurantiacum]SHN46697.1 iron complex transport system ATP-binding protein [Cryptosporangium aurantiacum]
MRVSGTDLTVVVRGRSLLSDVVLEAPSGSTVGLLGPNGSGKSTLLRTLAGFRRPERGRVCLDGVDRESLPRRAVARSVAVVTQQTPAELDLTVRDVLLLARIPHRPRLAPVTRDDVAGTERALADAGLPGYGGRAWSSLSGGERQRVDLARALLQDPDVLLLDEPTNHLDIRHQLELLENLATAPVTVVVALHGLDLAAQYCDRIVLLSDGRVVAAGTPADVLTPERIAAVFGVTATVTIDPDGRPDVRIRRGG